MTPIASLRFTDFVEILLGRLYALAKEAGDKYFNMHVLAGQLKQPIQSVEWIIDAGKALEAQRLARCIFLVGGSVYAKIAGAGREYIETGKGSGLAKQSSERPEEFFRPEALKEAVVGAANLADLADVVEIGRARRPAFELLDQIDESLKSDSTIDERRRRELLGDVGVVRQQFKKQEPNVPAIAALLAPLGQMPSVVTPVRSLIDLINV